MRIFKLLAAVVIAVILLLILIGAFLPQNAEIQRSITINQPAEKVFTIVNDLSQFKNWSPWHRIDPNTQYTYSGPKTGAGATMVWDSQHKHVGNGIQKIIESVPNEKVTIALDFGQQGRPVAELLMRETDGNTEVIWKLHSNADGNMVAKYFNLMLDSMVGPLYERGLENLKQLAEAQPQ